MAALKPSIFHRIKDRIFDYVKTVATDYKTVFIETVTDAPKHPLRSIVATSGVGVTLIAICTNPTERDMLNRLAQWRLDMGLIPNMIHSSKADNVLITRTKLLNEKRYDYYNCLLFSMVVQRRHDRDAKLYVAQDKNIKSWPWIEIFSNVIDIGAFNRFWFLEQEFVDCDIKQEEFLEVSPSHAVV